MSPSSYLRALLCSVAASVALLSLPASSLAAVTCNFVGPSLNVTLGDSDGVILGRTGDQLTVVATDASIPSMGPEAVIGQVQCNGGVPTVTTVDAVNVEESPNALSSNGGFIDLRGGPLGPGLTPEPDGSSEIELRFSLGLGEAYLEIAGSGGSDQITLGTTAAAPISANLNAQEVAKDVDVEFLVSNPLTFVNAGSGADRISLAGGSGFASSLKEFLSLKGGGDNNHLIGGPGRNFLFGGAGNDRISGKGGRDVLSGGQGRDLIAGGSGRDVIDLARGGRDRANCGSGRDSGRADANDKAKSCEQLKLGPGTLDVS